MTTIKIFLGGGVKLLHGENEFLKGYRNDVIDPIISQLNSREYVKHFFIAKDFTDLTRNVVSGKHQEVYNTYIVHEAQIALFIFDGEIGNITKHEIDIAIASTKKTRHPIVYVYGKNIKDVEILDYLNQEGIYFQHFYDNRDLVAKIKADLETATRRIERQHMFRLWVSIVLSVILCSSAFFLAKNCINTTEAEVDKCTAQLYLMRYHDVNALTGTNVFDNTLLSNFKYEDSVMAGGDFSVFPIISNDSLINITPPFFRLKLHNKHRNTIVFIEAKLEVDNYNTDTIFTKTQSFIPIRKWNDVDIVNVNSKISEYSLNGFRQNVAYGEIDDRYFFTLLVDENCSFRMRVRAKSQLGDYLYSNYVYVKCVKSN